MAGGLYHHGQRLVRQNHSLNSRGENRAKRFKADYSSSWRLIRHCCKSPGFCHTALWEKGLWRYIRLIQLEPEAVTRSCHHPLRLPDSPSWTHHPSASGSTFSHCTCRSQPRCGLAPVPHTPCRVAAPRSWPCWSGCGPWRSCTHCGPAGTVKRDGQQGQAQGTARGMICPAAHPSPLMAGKRFICRGIKRWPWFCSRRTSAGAWARWLGHPWLPSSPDMEDPTGRGPMSSVWPPRSWEGPHSMYLPGSPPGPTVAKSMEQQGETVRASRAKTLMCSKSLLFEPLMSLHISEVSCSYGNTITCPMRPHSNRFNGTLPLLRAPAPMVPALLAGVLLPTLGGNLMHLKSHFLQHCSDLL